ncbi:MAG: flagellar basal body-associated FliL family protein [Rhodospirillaceae bacterium]|nr:flagellar basal body-associated FliL family protein [Rhodospirillaceae bacterium]
MSQDEDFEGDAEPEFEGGGGGGGKKKLLLMIVIPLVLVIGGAVAAYFSGLADPLIAMITGEKAEEQAAAEGGGGGAAAPAEGAPAAAPAAPGATGAVFYDLPEMLVNLNTPGRKRNFLKMRVSLELSAETDINRVETVLPRIVDNFQVYLRELRLEDLQGAAGMYRLREELLSRVNAAVRPAQVKDVLFKEMIVQ